MRSRCRDDRGYVLVLAGLLILPLLAITGLATDVGSWYARASRIQRAADAAALAGVVWMPDFDKASQVALDIAARNGFEDGTDDIDIVVSKDTSSNRRLRVNITDTDANLYFSSVFLDDVEIERESTAEYVLPVPLGSPDSNFGNDPESGYQPNLWAAIQGPYTDREDGDPYATKCLDGSSSGTTCNGTNPQYRDDGYLYAVEVPESAVGQTLTVEVYDAGFYDRGSLNNETGDYRLDGSNPSPSMEFELHSADNSPLDNDDNPSLNGSCTAGPGYLLIDGEAQSGTYENRWTTLCQITVSTPGIYPLRVKTSDIAPEPDIGNATSHYSLRTALSGTDQPRIYGIGDISIFNNLDGSTAEFFLAEVSDIHAGKTLQIDLFDPGDGSSGDFYMSILDPTGAIVSECTWDSDDGESATETPCTIQTRRAASSPANKFNSEWLTITMPLADDYACGSSCWWKIRYQFSGTPTDRTTWSVNVIGDPVHLVNNS